MNFRRKGFLTKSKRGNSMKSLLKKKNGNEERQEIKGEKLYGSRNLFGQ